MNRWDKAGVPHKGWACAAVIDLEEAVHTCEMCGHEQIRYVHEMTHVEHENIRVGCVCAAKMCDGYDAKRAESDLKSRLNRKLTFRHGWKTSKSGNKTRVKNGVRVTIGHGQYGGFWVRVRDDFVKAKGGWPKTFEAACEMAFDHLNPPINVKAFVTART